MRCLTNKEASTVLCSATQEAVEHERSVGENTRRSALPLPKCFTTQHRTSRGFFICFIYDEEFTNFPAHSLTKLYFPKE